MQGLPRTKDLLGRGKGRGLHAPAGGAEAMICGNTDCKKEFEPATHNMKYCCAECCRIATNRRIKEKYHENKARLAGKDRRCSDCNTALSRYNRGDVCNYCESARVVNTRLQVLEFLGAR